MTLRHIRPGTIEWYDAVVEAEGKQEVLTPEEQVRLRTLLQAEQLSESSRRFGPQRV